MQGPSEPEVGVSEITKTQQYTYLSVKYPVTDAVLLKAFYVGCESKIC